MTRLNLDQLRTFLAIARLGGIRKAAAGLHITQPAVTARIRALETTLGAELFERTNTGMRLTKRGELLLRHAEQFENLAQAVEQDIVDPAGIDRHLRLGVSETIAQCWLPDFVTELHQCYPQLHIEIKVDISVNLRADLLDRKIDLAFLLGPVSDYTVDNIELPSFALRWYVAADTPDPAGGVAALFERPVITYARHTRPYRELKAQLFEHYGTGVTLFPSSSLSACFRMVEAGMGIAALPVALGQPYVRSGTLRNFQPGWLPPPLQFAAAYLGEPQSHLLRSAAELAREVARRADGDK